MYARHLLTTLTTPFAARRAARARSSADLAPSAGGAAGPVSTRHARDAAGPPHAGAPQAAPPPAGPPAAGGRVAFRPVATPTPGPPPGARLARHAAIAASLLAAAPLASPATARADGTVVVKS